MIRLLGMLVFMVCVLGASSVDAQLFRRFRPQPPQFQQQQFQQRLQQQQFQLQQLQQQQLQQQQLQFRNGPLQQYRQFVQQQLGQQQQNQQAAQLRQTQCYQQQLERARLEQLEIQQRLRLAGVQQATTGTQRFQMFYNPRTNQTVLRPVGPVIQNRQTVVQPQQAIVAAAQVQQPSVVGQIDVARQATTAQVPVPNSSGPSLGGLSLNESNLGGPSLNEPDLGGSILSGLSLNGPTLNAPSLNGPSLNAPTVTTNNTALNAPVAGNTILGAPALNAPIVDNSVTQVSGIEPATTTPSAKVVEATDDVAPATVEEETGSFSVLENSKIDQSEEPGSLDGSLFGESDK